jgi:precorrin-6A/cobalt-precorrin-6A reductase
MTKRILILGGTTEAYALAAALAPRRELHVITSLAGRTVAPRQPEGALRVGGFGGVAGLVSYLLEQQIDAVIDATHPFAAAMAWNAAAACREAMLPLLRLERPAWVPEPEDRWELVEHWEQALAALVRDGAQRVFLAVGRQELAPFAGIDALWFLIRVVTAPDPALHFPAAQVLLARGPFALASERALLAEHAIDTIVCKNSGGAATAAKLTAARERGIRVILRQRPLRPTLPLAITLAEAGAWLDELLA